FDKIDLAVGQFERHPRIGWQRVKQAQPQASLRHIADDAEKFAALADQLGGAYQQGKALGAAHILVRARAADIVTDWRVVHRLSLPCPNALTASDSSPRE